MTVRFYSSVSAETTLTNAINNSVTSMQVGSTTGLPSVPFTMAVDYESASEELVEVTVVAGTTLTITRAIDGTSAASHNSGARVRHVSSARDFSDSRSHENATADVHGLTAGAVVVGTTTTQTLTNKTLSGGVLSGTFTGSPTLSGTVTFSGAPVFSGTANHTGVIQSTQSAATNTSLATIVTADTFDRFRILADGDMEWGPGSGARDVQLYRDAADVLATNDTFRTYGSGASTDAIQTRVTGDTVSRLNIDADGGMSWGPGGGTAQDTNLYRSAANTLKTDDALIVTGAASTGNLTVTGTVTGTGTADFGHTEITSGITYATDFSAGSMVYRETAGLHFLDVEVVRSGATFTPAGTSGNISPDLTICTLPAGTRPPSALYVCASTGIGDGSLRINTDGTCELLTWMPDPVTITNGSTIRFTVTWID